MIEQTAKLVGVMPKKGSGKFDDGREWATDHVELHVLTPLAGEGSGFATTIHKIQNCDQNINKAKELVGRDIVLTLELTTNGKNNNTLIKASGFRALTAKAA
jgi:hypothetical protein